MRETTYHSGCRRWCCTATADNSFCFNRHRTQIHKLLWLYNIFYNGKIGVVFHELISCKCLGVSISKFFLLAVWPFKQNLAANGRGCDKKKLK